MCFFVLACVLVCVLGVGGVFFWQGVGEKLTAHAGQWGGDPNAQRIIKKMKQNTKRLFVNKNKKNKKVLTTC